MADRVPITIRFGMTFEIPSELDAASGALIARLRAAAALLDSMVDEDIGADEHSLMDCIVAIEDLLQVCRRAKASRPASEEEGGDA